MTTCGKFLDRIKSAVLSFKAEPCTMIPSALPAEITLFTVSPGYDSVEVSIRVTV